MGYTKIESVDGFIRLIRERTETAMEEEEMICFMDSQIQTWEEEVTLADYEELLDKVMRRTLSRLGMLESMLEDDSVQEIMINGIEDVFLERRDGIIRISNVFESVEELEDIIRAIAAMVHREFNEMSPILDARLPDGSRVNAVYRNIVLEGPILTIRKFSKEHLTVSDMVALGTVTEQCAEDLRALVSCGYNIFISGGTSSGKTTFLNALADMIPKKERVIVIEDSRELAPENLENLVQMECHNANSTGNGEITMDALIRTSLRMRPDRLIVGEVRGREVIDMLQAMNTGHDGCLSTGHGNSAEGMLRRIEAMYLSGVDMPIEAIRSQIVEGIDILVHLQRDKEGGRRVTEIQEIRGTKDGEYLLNPLYIMKEGRLTRTGNPLKARQRLELRIGDLSHGL